MTNSKNLQIGDIVEHEDGHKGIVLEVNYCDPTYYIDLGYGSAEAYEICDEVKVGWLGELSRNIAPKTSVKFLTKINYAS